MRTILVVDDEYLIAQILGYALEDAGYVVETASNGQKALDILKDKPVDLVITDYMMPQKNGEELANTIREDPQWQNLPLILMSAAQAYEARGNPGLFVAVFDKPFDIFTMIAKVEELVGPPESS
ncbi:response regulator [Pseudomonas putida]|uniref:response regulator n=1 Tax=Pseudomonas putida TaxID=303 RepID=UPI0023661CD2|nr:response regulator [Pseudomonas putida]MDD2046069.1 response regulator [Pseudomonas putida]